jgi:asparagine synthase (glutamine-hydrolysing)
MRHRGPDGSGCHHDSENNLVLEHCRLAIIDPDNPAANQPFTDAAGRRLIIYNGELFNFRALRRELEQTGVIFRTESDTEVVLEAFAKYGESVLSRLKGMFAFVIWDRETRELFAARDHVGVKPLYYTVEDGLFVAASELRTLMRHPRVTARLSPPNVVEYLSFGHVVGERTLLEGVYKLPPGHAFRVRNGRAEVFEYWDVLPSHSSVSNEPLEAELLGLLDAAVESSLVSDVPIGLMLSGGLDSSAIAALAVRHADVGALTAYSIDFGLPDDESKAAGQLARELGIRHRVTTLTEEHLRDEFDDWLVQMDVPSGNPTWIAVTQIARAAHADGIKVLLSGDGGDELFGGYSRWMTYLRFHDRVWRRLPRPLRKMVGKGTRPFARGLRGDIARRACRGGELFVGSRPFHDDDLARYLGPVGREAAAASPPEASVERLRNRFLERFPEGDYLAWMSYVAFKHHLVEDYLGRLDTMGMQQSVEGRVPLLDPTLASWAFAVPQERKIERYQQKALFRRTVGGLLPDYVTQRPKQGFCPPVASWATKLLAPRLDCESLLVDHGLLKPDAIARLRQDPTVGKSFALWTAGTLSAWCEANVSF